MAKEQKQPKEQKEAKEKKVKAVEEKKPEPKVVEPKIPARLKEKYQKEILPKLREQFAYKSIMEVPKLHKIVINMGVGQAASDAKILDEAIRDLETISGQKASVRIAKKAISNFKLREGMKIGAKVTLRKEMMYEFLDRFISLALPRVRDFRGVPDKSFDGRGNYTLGLKEQIIFPEINVDKVTKILGMDITFVTTAKTDKEALELLTAFGMPFRKKEIN
ncbi:MAG: 50S ribosomal protein L5 [Ignavibacteriae bacterium HGW-Ignavibacteriae-3]|nr:MAG: 50S ribosomal protein L5 [Ignavibacteriae bacterium HGW-Ignavibacteriae-3]